jgi:SAM-dependent methyltransferase
MVRDVLVYGGFDLGLDEVGLESPAEDHRRLDVAVGAVIIECKRDLRPLGNLTRAREQLEEYLAAKASYGRYAGLLTDGAIWQLYRYGASGIEAVDEFVLMPTRIDERAFRWWLGAVLSTEQRIQPSARAMEERLGAETPSFRLLYGTLLECWTEVATTPSVALKRHLWAVLLRSALGSHFEDTDELFLEHTYLALVASLIGHAVAGFDLSGHRHSPGVLVSGQLFEQAGILGVGEAGFFDWVMDSSQGGGVVSEIARRVASFDWSHVEHDVLKALYQSVIPAEVRKRLGEYYTPDWLAQRIVAEVLDEPLRQRVLDPACGSGTFVFHAVRRKVEAAQQAGMAPVDTLTMATSSVFGMDLHPVAVALAQTTYLLAIGRELLAQRTGTVTVPVYLGDSMRWDAAEVSVFARSGEVVLQTSDDADLFASELRFPASVVADVGRFDTLVDELAKRASDRKRGGPRPPVGGLLRSLAVAEEDRPTIEATYGVLCNLYDEGRNHIWGYYVRNQSRPTWLSRPENRVDVLVGNPPWLAYRFMSAVLQRTFERRARERHLWMGGARGRTTQQDLSAFFVARCVELYLRLGGRFGFVVPRALLSRQTYAGFRAGAFSGPSEVCSVNFGTAWDLGKVDPEPFLVPSAVVLGSRSEDAHALSEAVIEWSGRPPEHDGTWSFSSRAAVVTAVTGEEEASPYRERFRQGAILVPRMLILVRDAATTPLGVPRGRRAVESRKSSLDKAPWRDLPRQEGVVEDIFLRPAYLGESVLPFRTLPPAQAVIPYDGSRLMDGSDERIDRYPGLAHWWRSAEATWVQRRSSEKRLLGEQLDYMRQLSAQFPVPECRVVYTKAGSNLAAAIIEDRRAVIDHKLYWAAAGSEEEALFLCAFLNSPALGEIVRPFQSVGAFGPRDFDKYVWQAPVPLFDGGDSRHRELVGIARECRRVAVGVRLSEDASFKTSRHEIRGALAAAGMGRALDDAVRAILGL